PGTGLRRTAWGAGKDRARDRPGEDPRGRKTHSGSGEPAAEGAGHTGGGSDLGRSHRWPGVAGDRRPGRGGDRTSGVVAPGGAVGRLGRVGYGRREPDVEDPGAAT